jgi:hypothetical protein
MTEFQRSQNDSYCGENVGFISLLAGRGELSPGIGDIWRTVRFPFTESPGKFRPSEAVYGRKFFSGLEST